MRSRYVRLALAATMAMVAVSCRNCGWRRTPDVITVRWPATAPVALALAQGREMPSSGWPESALDDPLPPTEIAPGVRVRGGAAHDLSYFEIVLGDADFDDALPLVVLLHGRGDRPRIPGGPFSGVPTPMRLVMPRGPIPLGAGFAWMLPSVMHGRPDLLASTLRTRTDHLAALIKTLSRTLPTLGRPIVSGFSQGALLTFSLALHRPDVVGHAFPMTGWVPPLLMPTYPVVPELRVPIRAVHGTDDLVIPVAPTREVVAMLRGLGWEVEFVEFDGVGHMVSAEMNATFEAWLEDALREQASALTGRGLGLAGPEAETYVPWEPLEPETIEAIEQLEAQEAAPPVPSREDAPPAEETPGESDSGSGGNGTGDDPVEDDDATVDP